MEVVDEFKGVSSLDEEGVVEEEPDEELDGFPEAWLTGMAVSLASKKLLIPGQ